MSQSIMLVSRVARSGDERGTYMFVAQEEFLVVPMFWRCGTYVLSSSLCEKRILYTVLLQAVVQRMFEVS
jgi:hypothetical protein